MKMARKSFEVLIVENDPADVDLTKEALHEQYDHLPLNLSVVEDGEEAMTFLRRQTPFENAPRPDIVLLDLNMPRKDGREVLKEMKSADELKSIPVLVLTTSSAPEDVALSYRMGANSYITKAEDFNIFLKNIKVIQEYWFNVATLPAK
jgi:two-component system response regulator